MSKKLKSGKRYCTLGLQRRGFPLVVYRVDESGKPVINGREILLIGLNDNFSVEKAEINIHGPTYYFLRGGVLIGDYDETRCKLSKPDWDLLRAIYLQKSRMLEGRV